MLPRIIPMLCLLICTAESVSLAQRFRGCGGRIERRQRKSQHPFGLTVGTHGNADGRCAPNAISEPLYTVILGISATATVVSAAK